MRKIISVIIPTLNERETLPNLLKDFVKQTNKNFEIIVVDAESEDNTVEVAKAFADKLDLKIVVSKRRNLAYQRNLGAKKAKGFYLVFIDADSRVRRSFINNIFKEIDKKKPLVIYPLLDIKVKDLTDKTLFSLTNYALKTSLLLHLPFSPGACLIFERNFFFFVGGFKVTKKQDKKVLFPEDVEIMKRVLKSGVSPYLSDKVKFKFSMRRFKKEGYLKILKDYF